MVQLRVTESPGLSQDGDTVRTGTGLPAGVSTRRSIGGTHTQVRLLDSLGDTLSLKASLHVVVDVSFFTLPRHA